MAEAHADVADDDPLFGIEGDIARSLVDADIAYAERLAEGAVFRQLCRIRSGAVVAVFFGELCLGSLRLFVYLRAHFVAEDHFGFVCHDCLRYQVFFS